jgi:hypothetical protein
MFELDSANVAFNPQNRCFNSLQAFKANPNVLAYRRTFDEFNFTALGGRIEKANPITADASTADRDLGSKLHSVRAAWRFRTGSVGAHAGKITQICPDRGGPYAGTSKSNLKVTGATVPSRPPIYSES